MSFLSSVAHQLINTFGTDLSNVTVVFPNKRASLFLNEHLARLSDKPVWSPSYTTISDLFRSLSSREVADPIKLICDLYKSFIACTGINESLDHFYGWGEILLADFDDVDKHMAPAEKVFANLRDIHEFDDDSYLTEQQRETIRKFFSNFNEDHNTELKQRFLSLWSHIHDIYLDFNARLASQNLAYEGALYREVILLLGPGPNPKFFSTEDRSDRLRSGSYVFVGFNLLHPVEQALIDLLGDRATVITDTDEETPKNISIISAPTDNIQARYISTWLKEDNRIAAGSKTAIVLADESLLQTAIHCLPPEVTKVNITTGYPLSQATHGTSSLCEQRSELQGDSPHVLSSYLSSLISHVKSTAAANSPFSILHSPLESEALFRLYTILNRLKSLVDAGDLQVELPTLQHLLTQIIASTTIPFHGEPIEGIQIMGVLETRNLDFDHVLLLSCNEGNLPKGVNDTSFIPYSIRKAYNLTTIDHKISIYHNYFRRLLQRASDVTILYNNSTNDGKTGEMSQFILQLLVESSHPISFKTLQAGQQPVLHQPQSITKTPDVMEALRQRFSGKILSPSALARYLRCPLQFFYRYAAQLEELEDEEDTIDNRIFGNIFHKAAQLLYTPFNSPSSILTLQTIDSLLKSDVDIIRAVDRAFIIEYFHIEDPAATLPPLNGLQIINREVIIKYVHQLLEVDRRLTPFTILGLEKMVSTKVDVPNIGTMTLGGFVDRIDKITLPDGTERVRVVDYKTGSSRLKPIQDIPAIFNPENIKNHSDYYLQTILYSLIFNSCIPPVASQQSWSAQFPISPCLLFIQHAGTDNYDPTLKLGKSPITDINDIREDFMSHLQALLSEIFAPTLPFTPTSDRTRCKSCPFSSLC